MNVNDQQQGSANQTGPLPQPAKRWAVSWLALILSAATSGIGGAYGVWTDVRHSIEVVDEGNHQLKGELLVLKERCVATREMIERLESQLDSIEMYLRGLHGRETFWEPEPTTRLTSDEHTK